MRLAPRVVVLCLVLRALVACALGEERKERPMWVDGATELYTPRRREETQERPTVVDVIPVLYAPRWREELQERPHGVDGVTFLFAPRWRLEEDRRLVLRPLPPPHHDTGGCLTGRSGLQAPSRHRLPSL